MPRLTGTIMHNPGPAAVAVGEVYKTPWPTIHLEQGYILVEITRCYPNRHFRGDPPKQGDEVLVTVRILDRTPDWALDRFHRLTRRGLITGLGTSWLLPATEEEIGLFKKWKGAGDAS